MYVQLLNFNRLHQKYSHHLSVSIRWMCQLRRVNHLSVTLNHRELPTFQHSTIWNANFAETYHIYHSLLYIPNEGRAKSCWWWSEVLIKWRFVIYVFDVCVSTDSFNFKRYNNSTLDKSGKKVHSFYYSIQLNPITLYRFFCCLWSLTMLSIWRFVPWIIYNNNNRISLSVWKCLLLSC